MSEVVLDASVVTDLLIGVGQVDRLVEMSAQRWHAPAHLDVEVTSALRGLVLGGHLSPSRAVDALQDARDDDPQASALRPRCLTKPQRQGFTWILDPGSGPEVAAMPSRCSLRRA